MLRALQCRRLVSTYFGIAFAAVLCAGGDKLALGASQATLGHARFTVVTPQLVRMEYSVADRFVDAPSWFAVNRAARFEDATINQNGDTLTIDTGVIRLIYHNDGNPFSVGNLSAVIRRGDGTVNWHVGDANRGNLGGTLRTVDQLSHAVPLGEGVVSRDGWYVLDDSNTTLFTKDWAESRRADGGSDWYLFGYGLDYRAALKSLTTIGGPVPLPRKYSLGLWYSRYWSFTAAAFEQIVEEYDRHGFPLDMMVLDMGWHLNAVPAGIKQKIDTWTGYTWDKDLIPDPATLLKWLHDRGLHVTLNEHPAAGVQPHEEMYAPFMRALGQDSGSGRTVPFDAGSKTYLDTFYAFTHAPREREGVDFWWLDWQQFPKTRSIPDLDNLRLLNWYNYHHTSTGEQRGESFSRWAGWGDHRYPIHFSGDADTGWPMLAFEVPFTSTAGNVGAFFWSHDIGGHMGGRNEESYARWCQFGALSAALRSHSTKDPTTDRRPWNYPDWAEASMRVSFRLRSQLMPYLYTAIHQATADSVPFTRPLYLDFPAAEAAYHNGQEYLFGDNLLVAPITKPGTGQGRVAAQAVWFPPGGDWYDFFSGEKFAGDTSAVATAAIDCFPLYVRGGVPLPMQPVTLRPGTATLETLIVRCYPGQENKVGVATVYEDDGVTTGYQHGASASTSLSYAKHGDVVTLVIGATQGTYPGRPDKRSVVVELPDTEPGATADVGTCTYSATTATTRVTLPPASVEAARVVTVHVTERPPQRVIAAAVAERLTRLLGGAKTDAQTATLDAQTQRMVAAVKGVAVLTVNQHPYELGDDVALVYFHNHATGVETLMLADPTPHAVMVRPGEAIARSAAESVDALRFDRGAVVTGLPDGLLPLSIDLPEVVKPEDDLAIKATATASTGTAAAAVDGSIEGYPADQSREWVTQRERAGAWLQLDWDRPTKMSRVLLYDRPNAADHVLAGRLTFGDGTSVDVGPLPNDGQRPAAFTFPEKTCKWVRFTVTEADPRTQNIGLSEMAVTDVP